MATVLCRIFSPEAACEVIEAERHSHVFHQAEPDIWMVMVRYLFLNNSLTYGLQYCLFIVKYLSMSSLACDPLLTFAYHTFVTM